MKDYKIENGFNVHTARLEAHNVNTSRYRDAHRNQVISCHDVFIEYQNGILLVIRKEFPAKGILWPIGGRINRGISTKDSLLRKVRAESHLDLSDLTYLDTARTQFQTDPFGHGHGTDTINLVYFARGIGTLTLDSLHEKSTIVTPEMFQGQFGNNLHPYVSDFLDRIFSDNN